MHIQRERLTIHYTPHTTHHRNSKENPLRRIYTANTYSIRVYALHTHTLTHSYTTLSFLLWGVCTHHLHTYMLTHLQSSHSVCPHLMPNAYIKKENGATVYIHTHTIHYSKHHLLIHKLDTVYTRVVTHSLLLLHHRPRKSGQNQTMPRQTPAKTQVSSAWEVDWSLQGWYVLYVCTSKEIDSKSTKLHTNLCQLIEAKKGTVHALLPQYTPPTVHLCAFPKYSRCTPVGTSLPHSTTANSR